MDKSGVVFLVGAGPGDPKLITVKGVELLKRCDVVIYDRLASSQLLNYVKENCEKIYVGKRVGSHTFKQNEINDIIIKKALDGNMIVRLKGGDPFVFGRGGEEILALQEHDIPYEVVPGITSSIAVPASAGIPVTHRGMSQSFHVVTGHTQESADSTQDHFRGEIEDFTQDHFQGEIEDSTQKRFRGEIDDSTQDHLPGEFETLARLEGTLVFLMGIGNLKKIISRLIKHGKEPNTPAAVISKGTTPDQKMVKGTLEDICEKVQQGNIKAPAVFVVGQTVSLNLSSTHVLPLSGVRVGITGTKALTSRLAERLEEQGATVECMNFMRIQVYKENNKFDQALSNLTAYTWVLFTSMNAIAIFFQKLQEFKLDHRKLAHLKFATVGKGTKEVLLKHGFIADFVPERYTTRDLAEGICRELSDSDHLLIPRAEQGSAELTMIFDQHQISYEDIKIYDIVNEKEYRDEVFEEMDSFDYLTFASASGVNGFFEDNQERAKAILNDTKVVCIGDMTAARLYEYGCEAELIAKEYSVDGLVDRICEHQKG